MSELEAVTQEMVRTHVSSRWPDVKPMFGPAGIFWLMAVDSAPPGDKFVVGRIDLEAAAASNPKSLAQTIDGEIASMLDQMQPLYEDAFKAR